MAFRGRDGQPLGKGLSALLKEMAGDPPVIASTVCAAQEGASAGFNADPVDIVIDLGVEPYPGARQAWGLVNPGYPYEVTGWSYDVETAHPAEVVARILRDHVWGGVEHFYINAGGMGYKYLRVRLRDLVVAFTELGFDVSPEGLAARHAEVAEAARAAALEDADAEAAEDERQLQVGLIADVPCPVCGELGACGYDAEGRPMIHAIPADPDLED
jgi:hypothetical protein